MKIVALAACLITCASVALAQPYPAKPVRLIVPYPPGGGTDFFARLVGDAGVRQKLTEVE